MIPKKIHYIWLGGKPLPQSAEKCIKSWKKFCPDYEIIKWDESNLNIDICKYCRQAYDAKKYAFASDVLRYWVIFNEGGLYFDVDVEVLKNFDIFLNDKLFFGFETEKAVAPGLGFGAEKNNEIIGKLLKDYEERSFINSDGSYNFVTIGDTATVYLMELGLEQKNVLQRLDSFVAYPSEYFCPMLYKGGEVKITPNTHSIHLYNGSWVNSQPFYKKIINKMKSILKKIFKRRANGK